MIDIVVTAESSSHCCGQRLNIHIGSHREINLSQEALVLSQHFKVMSLHCNTDCDGVKLSEYFKFSWPVATLWSLSSNIGDSNILEAKSFVGRNMNLSNGCIVGAGCRLTAEETLTENSVVYGGVCSRRLAKERPAPQTLQIDFLSKVLLSA